MELASEELAYTPLIFALFLCSPRSNLFDMPQQNTAALAGNSKNRVAEALRAARQQVWLAQTDASPRMWDALRELDHILEDQIAAIANAAVDDTSDAKLAGTWLD